MLPSTEALPVVVRLPITAVLAQHVEDSAVLHNTRTVLVSAPHAKLLHLGRLDDRLAAHLDGCLVAGQEGLRTLVERLADPGPAELFTVAAVALEIRDRERVRHCLTVAESVPESAPGLTSAFGWVVPDRLAGVACDLLRSDNGFRRGLGLAACRVHGVDPGPSLLSGAGDPDVRVRAEAFRTAAVLGKQDVGPASLEALADEDPNSRFWASWAAVVLGDRGMALDALADTGCEPGVHRSRAFRLSLQAMTPVRAHGLLQRHAQAGTPLRWLIQGSGIAGDPSYLPWLMGHMRNVETARLAGEAFSLITGADLAWLDLERRPPENFESGPNDDPGEMNVDMDADEGLPWPDVTRVEKWYTSNSGRFQDGTRYFMGAPLAWQHCVDVLKNGYQRQRILAAHYLCLLSPGTPLFNTSAPTWRQRRLIAAAFPA